MSLYLVPNVCNGFTKLSIYFAQHKLLSVIDPVRPSPGAAIPPISAPFHRYQNSDLLNSYRPYRCRPRFVKGFLHQTRQYHELFVNQFRTTLAPKYSPAAGAVVALLRAIAFAFLQKGLQLRTVILTPSLHQTCTHYAIFPPLPTPKAQVWGHVQCSVRSR